MKVRERSSGRWAIVVELRDPETGKRKRKWHSFRGNKRAAQDECVRLIAELNGGLYLEPTKITVGQFLDRWLEHIKPLVSPRTHERYGELTSQSGRCGRSAQERARGHDHLRSRSDRRPDRCNARHADDDHRHSAVLCGLRRGEIAALRWRNVNLGAAQLAVTESAERTGAGVRYKKPKSGKGRTVALSARVVNEPSRCASPGASQARRSVDGQRVCCCPGGWQAVAAANHHAAMVPAAGNQQDAAAHSLPRPAVRARDPHAVLGRPSQDCQRAPRTLEGRDHDGLLFACDAGNAGRRCRAR